MVRLLIAWAVCLPLLLGCITTPVWSAQKFTLNLKEADIHALINTVSDITGRNFVIDPRVKGKVTVVSSTPTDPESLYEVFLSILHVHGYAAIPTGKVIKVIPDTVAKQDGGAGLIEDQPPAGDEIATLVVALQHVAAAELVPILRPLVPQHGHLAAHSKSNLLLVADKAANIRRMAHIVERIDQPADRAIDVIAVEHASAVDLVQVLTGLTSAVSGHDGGAKPTIAADERTNSILVGGDRRLRLEIRALISHLDAPIPSAGNTEVVYLRYADAGQMVPILQQLGERQSGGGGKASSKTAQGSTTEIMADEANNALVLMAEPRRMRELKSLIRQLDVRRAQVLVEAIIAEVSSDKSVELGVQWRTPERSSGTFGSIELSGLQAVSPISAFDPVSPGIGLSLGVFRGGSIRVLLEALAGDVDTNVLSTPTLVTMDNEEAEIIAGQNVPFVTGSYTSTGSGTTPSDPFQTIERQDVGIVLKVKPQINEGDSVKLAIEQEISSVIEGTAGQDLQTNKRAIKTTVLVDDGDIIVLGGLIEDDLQESTERVPLLGDIPVLGALFSSNRSRYVKRNLMVFLKPKIIRDSSTGSYLTHHKYSLLRNRQLQARHEDVLLMPGEERPLLLELDRLLEHGQMAPSRQTETHRP